MAISSWEKELVKTCLETWGIASLSLGVVIAMTRRVMDKRKMIILRFPLETWGIASLSLGVVIAMT